MTLPTDQLERLAVDTIRTLSIDGVQQANSGHPGAPMGMAADDLRAVDEAPPPRAHGPRLAEPGPLRPVRRPREHAPVLDAPPDRLRGLPRRPQELPPVGLDHPGPPGVRPHPGRRGHHRPAGPGPRQRRGHGHRGAPPRRGVQPARPRHHRPPHLRHLLRRRPPGGHHGRGRIARRPPEARQADRPVRRQPDPARRPHRLDLHRGRHRPLRGVRLAHPARRRRQRRRRDQRRDRGRQGGRPALADRRPHDDRLRQPQQGGLAEEPRRPAGPRRGPPHQGGLRLGPGEDLLRARGGRASCSCAPWTRARRPWPNGMRPSTPTPPPTPPRPPSCGAASPGAWPTAGTPGSTSTRPAPRSRHATRART